MTNGDRIQKQTLGLLGAHSLTPFVAGPHSKVLKSWQSRCDLCPSGCIAANVLRGITAKIPFRFQVALDVLAYFGVSESDPLQNRSLTKRTGLHRFRSWNASGRGHRPPLSSKTPPIHRAVPLLALAENVAD
jgi:hypothetical protein